MKLSSKTSVAFIQNRIQPGGRFQVMAEMISVLNEFGIVPHILTFRSKLDRKSAQSFYNRSLEFEIVEVGGQFPMPFEWNILWFNRKVNKYLDKFDLVINHNNTSFGLSCKAKVMSYVHFPRKYRLRSRIKNIHLPERGAPGFINFKSDFLNLASLYYRTDRKICKGEYSLANSEFSKESLLKTYPSLKSEDVKVLYPPVEVKAAEVKNKSEQVVSLGRYSADKRQLEQIEIAAQIPELPFKLVGFKADAEYYDKCEKRIAELGLKNVELVTDASRDEVEQILASSTYFIHCVRNEPFGITTVQAIANGCIPVVHNSGGQREVVDIAELRFENPEGAVDILKRISSNSSNVPTGVEQLPSKIDRFKTLTFRAQFKNHLLDMI